MAAQLKTRESLEVEITSLKEKFEQYREKFQPQLPGDSGVMSFESELERSSIEVAQHVLSTNNKGSAPQTFSVKEKIEDIESEVAQAKSIITLLTKKIENAEGQLTLLKAFIDQEKKSLATNISQISVGLSDDGPKLPCSGKVSVVGTSTLQATAASDSIELTDATQLSFPELCDDPKLPCSGKLSAVEISAVQTTAASDGTEPSVPEFSDIPELPSPEKFSVVEASADVFQLYAEFSNKIFELSHVATNELASGSQEVNNVPEYILLSSWIIKKAKTPLCFLVNLLALVVVSVSSFLSFGSQQQDLVENVLVDTEMDHGDDVLQEQDQSSELIERQRAQRLALRELTRARNAQVSNHNISPTASTTIAPLLTISESAMETT